LITGNKKAGSCCALYSTTFSERGVMLGAARAPRKPSEFDFQPPLIIKNPHTLPMYKEETQKWVMVYDCLLVMEQEGIKALDICLSPLPIYKRA